MAQPTVTTFGNLVKQPSALLPIGMSLVALLVVLTFLAKNGIVRQADEGSAAHIWQLLMAGQFLIMLYFAIRWLPRAPRQTLPVLGLQAGAALASMAPVFMLHL